MPVQSVVNGSSAHEVHSRLRQAILDGELNPDKPLSQVKLAKQLGVSRTPLREAMRMLEREGLIESTPNRRARVTVVSAADLDGLYGTRIMLEGLAASITVPQSGPTDLDGLAECLREMDAFEAEHDAAHWETPHRRLHLLFTAHAGERLVKLTGELSDHCERYRSAVLAEPRAWTIGAKEHASIADAYVIGDPEAAAQRLAHHLARTALTLLAHMAPDYEPRAIRTALRFVAPTSPSGQRPTDSASREGVL